jgi:hypothetical protein
MEPGGLLPHSQEPATCPYPEPAQSSPSYADQIFGSASVTIRKKYVQK